MRAIRYMPLLALLGACQWTRDPVAIEGAQTQFGVFSVLTAGSDSASVVVARFIPDPGPLHPGWEGVGGATVRLVAGTDTITLIEQPSESRTCASGFGGQQPALASGCYRAMIPGGIVAGASYGLIADVPAFGRIIGGTTIPFPPSIIAPEEGAVLSADRPNNEWPTVRLSIEMTPGTGRLEARLMPRDPNRTCEAYFLAGAAGIQGLLVLDPAEAQGIDIRYTARCYTTSGPVPIGELPAVIRAVAYDTAYARFAEVALDEGDQALLSPYARAGIDRGVGYFAGAAATERRVVITGQGG